jgi:hypothetical protein
MSINVTRDITGLWSFMGDGWANMNGSDIIETAWTALASGVDYVMISVMDAQNSRSLFYMPPLVENGQQTFTLLVSGLTTNTLPSDIGGIFKYYLNNWTLSIPSLIQTYKWNASGITNTYYENVDYTISGLNTLVWLTTPNWDQRYYPAAEVLTVYAPSIQVINPVLMNTWARALGIGISDFNQYNTYTDGSTTNVYKHLKYLIWALTYERLALPTVNNLTNGLAIAVGYPFAYCSGIVSYQPPMNGQTILQIGGYTDTYYIPSGITPIASGIWVNQFDILVPDAYLYDYYSNSGLVTQYSNVLTKYHTLVFQAAQLNNFGYSSSFFNDYKDSLLPVHYYFTMIQ